jgi:large subunit ribosomal protein L35
VPKNKTHSGIKKRVRITGSGKLLSQHSGMRHHQERKPSRLTRRLTGTKGIAAADAPRVKKLLGR